LHLLYAVLVKYHIVGVNPFLRERTWFRVFHAKLLIVLARVIGKKKPHIRYQFSMGARIDTENELGNFSNPRTGAQGLARSYGTVI